MFKKLELHSYIEGMREDANSQINHFFDGMDPNTAPRNIKLMYYYYVGSRNNYQEMTTEAVESYKNDLVQTKIAKDESKILFKGEKEMMKNRIMKRYGRDAQANVQKD